MAHRNEANFQVSPSIGALLISATTQMIARYQEDRLSVESCQNQHGWAMVMFDLIVPSMDLLDRRSSFKELP
jgi:hypothetical protein